MAEILPFSPLNQTKMKGTASQWPELEQTIRTWAFSGSCRFTRCTSRCLVLGIDLPSMLPHSIPVEFASSSCFEQYMLITILRRSKLADELKLLRFDSWILTTYLAASITFYVKLAAVLRERADLKKSIKAI
jgi:hypothetical protein